MNVSNQQNEIVRGWKVSFSGKHWFESVNKWISGIGENELWQVIQWYNALTQNPIQDRTKNIQFF